MSQTTEQKLSEGLPGPTRVCRELSTRHIGYLDLIDQSGVRGASIYGLWVFCNESTDDLVHLLEACRNGKANLVQVAAATIRESVRQRYNIDFDALIEYGRGLPSGQRLA